MPDVVKTVGRYEILRDLGRGGMSIVYLARQTDLDRFVALKELGAFHASDPAVAQRFLRESQMAGGLSHPNIAVVYDYFQHDGTPYIAMEYIERGSLRPHVGHMTLAQIAGVLEGLLAGLAHAEQHAIVHRDLKPENLMITADGRVKIADFGIAKATNRMQTRAFLTATGTTVGTPTYMAPEQAMAQEVGPWTDLYSVGVMAFEMFVGRTPFHESEAPMAILLRHVKEEIPPVKSLVPDVDERISAWIQRLLVKDPKQRTRSATVAWDELEEVVIAQLGPRWRRQARLMDRVGQIDTPKPLTPAPFLGTSAGDAVADEFESLPVGADTPVDTPTAPPGRTPAVAGKTAEPSAVPAAAAPARRSRRFAAVVAVAAVAAAAAGFALASSGDDEPSSAAVANGRLSLRVPDGWSTVARPPAIPGLTRTTTVAPGGRAGGQAVAFGLAVGNAENPLLLPNGLRDSLAGRPRPAAVRLRPEGLQAYRYADLRVNGIDRPLTVYAVPTSGGVAIVACVSPTADCEAIASSLRLSSLRAYPVGPSEDYARAVGRALSGLPSGPTRLRRASGRRSRERAARELSTAFRGAARAIRRTQAGPADRGLSATLTNALDRIDRGYRALSAAATDGNRGRDRSARLAIRRGERALEDAIGELRAAGYRLRG